MMAWYASLRGHQTIGVAMSDHAVRKFMQQALAQVKHGLCYQILSMLQIWSGWHKFY